uniref:Chitin-binding type-2 domain-containing protein n=1 Tax=Anopheles farauti TaxID=69004 RepID=A0A1Y9HB83_9DIPT
MSRAKMETRGAVSSAIPWLLFVLLTVAHGQEFYQDYLDMNDPQGSSVDDLLQANDVPSSLWFGSSSSSQLSPPFIDKTLTGTCSNTSAIVCTGCRRVRVCIPGISDEALLPENDCPPSTYCHTLAGGMGACLATIDPLFPECRASVEMGGGGGSVGILCTGAGVFPDPLDCRKFHYCTTVGRYARAFKCPSKYVYNSKKQTCSRNTPCRTVQCRPNGRSIFLPYPPDPAYYAYCNYHRIRRHPILRNIVMYKCAEGAEFNAQANSCVFKCTREGFMAKTGEPSKFYWCRKVGGKLFGYEQVCPGVGSTFSARFGICLPPPPMTTTTPVTPMITENSTTSVLPPDVPPDSTISNTDPTLAADTPVQLPPWPQWTSIPVSSLL